MTLHTMTTDAKRTILFTSCAGLAVLVAAFAGCAGAAANEDSKDIGAASSLTSSTPATAVVTGTVIHATSRAPVAGATVTAGPITATTDSAGRFSFTVPTGLADRPSVTHGEYARHSFETVAAVGDTDLGNLLLLSLSDQSTLRQVVGNYDTSLGALAVRVIARGACATEGGATLSVSPAGSSRVMYMRNSLPSSTATDVQSGQETSAFIYNLAVDQRISLTASREGCTMAAYPVTDQGVTRTGDIFTYGGDSLTFATAILE